MSGVKRGTRWTEFNLSGYCVEKMWAWLSSRQQPLSGTSRCRDGKNNTSGVDGMKDREGVYLEMVCQVPGAGGSQDEWRKLWHSSILADKVFVFMG